MVDPVRSQMFGRESRTAYFATAQAANALHVEISRGCTRPRRRLATTSWRSIERAAASARPARTAD